MSHHKKKAKINSFGNNGASILEFSIGATVFLVTLLSFMDLCRVLVVRSAMFSGAFNGVRVARVVKYLDTDTSNLSPLVDDQDQPNDDQLTLNRFLAARQAVVDEVLRLSGELVSPSESQGSARFTSVTQSYPLSASGQYTVTSDVAILRPGEGASAGSEVISYPATDEDNQSISFISMSEGLGRYPIIIELRAKVRSFIPVYRFEYNLGARAVAYRETGTLVSYNPTPPIPPSTPAYYPTSTPSPIPDSSGGSVSSASSTSASSSSSSTSGAPTGPFPSCALNETTAACVLPKVFDPSICACRNPPAS